MGGALPFYTLGIASYLDAGEKGEIYYKIKSRQSNSFLLQHFPVVYDKLAKTLKEVTGKEVQYEEGFALPGFHIFQFSKFFNYPIASSHFDVQYKEMFWKHRNIDYDHPISFTLALKLPQGGGGLNYWNIFYSDVKDLSNEELLRLKEETEQHFLKYQIGKIVIHEGLMLHQIAPAKDIQPEDARITLQGHGLVCDNILRVYW